MARRRTQEEKQAANRREECDYRHQALWNSSERQSFITRAQDICDHMLPHASSLLTKDVKHADERWRHIFDTTATEALDISVAGHMTYATPIGDGWLSLVLRDEPELTKELEVAGFLKELSKRMLSVAQQSNTEQDFRLLFRNALAFGGGASIVDEDDVYTLWHHHVPVGDYAIATNFRGQVDTLYREFSLTLKQAADQFGAERLCAESQRLLAQGPRNWDHPITIVHAIEPRKGGKSRSEDGKPLLNTEMAWRSVYWERDSQKHEGILRESGYRVFPVLAPRYDLLGIYGTGPGCIALAHIRSLQHRHHRLAECIDWQTKGLFSAPTLAGGSSQWRPGGKVLIDSPNPQPIRNVVDNASNLNHLLLDIENVREQIRRIMHADTFTLLSSIDRSNVTAEEVREKRQEKFDILGPLTARLLNEIPRPWVDICYAYMEARGQVPELPMALAERRATIDPEFESVLAKSAKSHRIASLQGFVGSIGLVATQIDKRVLHKVKPFDMANEFARTFDVQAELLRTDDEAQQIADAEAQAQAQADAAAVQAQQAQSLKAVGGISTTEPNLAMEAIRGGVA